MTSPLWYKTQQSDLHHWLQHRWCCLFGLFHLNDKNCDRRAWRFSSCCCVYVCVCESVYVCIHVCIAVIVTRWVRITAINTTYCMYCFLLYCETYTDCTYYFIQNQVTATAKYTHNILYVLFCIVLWDVLLFCTCCCIYLCHCFI